MRGPLRRGRGSGAWCNSLVVLLVVGALLALSRRGRQRGGRQGRVGHGADGGCDDRGRMSAQDGHGLSCSARRRLTLCVAVGALAVDPRPAVGRRLSELRVHHRPKWTLTPACHELVMTRGLLVGDDVVDDADEPLFCASRRASRAVILAARSTATGQRRVHEGVPRPWMPHHLAAAAGSGWDTAHLGGPSMMSSAAGWAGHHRAPPRPVSSPSTEDANDPVGTTGTAASAWRTSACRSPSVGTLDEP